MRVGQSDSFRCQAARFDHQTHIGQAHRVNMIEIIEIRQRISAIRQIATGKFRDDEWMDAKLVIVNQALHLRLEAAAAEQFDPDGSVRKYHSLSTVNPNEACARF